MAIFKAWSKKRIALLGSGTIAGFIIVSKLFPLSVGWSECLASSAIMSASSYQRLQSSEFMLKFDHPKIKRVYVNTLGSNSPNEDRYVTGGWKQDCTGLFGVIDGHKTQDCSEHLKNTLLAHVTDTFLEENVIESIKSEQYSIPLPDRFHSRDDRAKVVDHVLSLRPDGDDIPDDQECLLRERVEETLEKSFVSLDEKISENALKCVKLINKGRSIKEEGMLETIMKAVAGACTLLTLVSAQEIYVANTGDCRAVLGVKEGSRGGPRWSAVPLSTDQNAANSIEVERLKQEHPNEEASIIINNRLLGGLMPFRSFGDVDYKWLKEDVESITYIPPNYLTPPYLTARPEVTRRIWEGNEKFLILATDGLWDKLSNDKATNVVAASLYGDLPVSTRNSFTQFLTRSRTSVDECYCTDGNPATNLIWEALGGTKETVDNMLTLPKKISRMYRDDITVIVIEFN